MCIDPNCITRTWIKYAAYTHKQIYGKLPANEKIKKLDSQVDAQATPPQTGNIKYSIPDFRFQTRPRCTSRHAPTNANARLYNYKPSHHHTHSPAGNGFGGHNLGLRSGPIPPSTGNSTSLSGFIHIHRASQHAPANANARQDKPLQPSPHSLTNRK